MDLGLRDGAAVVAGGSRGMGRAVAEFLAAQVRMVPITPVLVRTGDSVVIRCVLPT